MSRSFQELLIRATPVLQLSDELRKEFVEIAATKSPSSAFDLALRLCRLRFNTIGAMQELGLAKATRWLAVVRRDHGQELFDQIVGG